MVWQRMLNNFGRSTKRTTGKLKKRRLLLQQMERRELLANDFASITGIAYVDSDANGTQDVGETVLENFVISLYEDTDGDGAFDINNDQLIGTDATDVNGAYRFGDLDGPDADSDNGKNPAFNGIYFAVQDYPLGMTSADFPGLVLPGPATVTVLEDDGEQVALIDDYSTADQSVTATLITTPVTDSDNTATSAIGGARDIQATHASGVDSITVNVNSTLGQIAFSAGFGTSGSGLVQYDGPDGTITLTPTGLNGANLSLSDPEAGLRLMAFGDNPGGTMTIRVYTNATDFSSTVINIPDSVQTEFLVPFSSFTPDPGGAGADFTNVGAIEAEVSLVANLDAGVTVVESLRPDVFTQNLASIQTVTLGGELFLDNSAAGQNDGVRQGTEAGLVGIAVDLYKLANPTDVVDPLTDTILTSTTTTTGGVYSFPGLQPGHYATVVPASQFAAAAQLFGFENSTGNDPLNDPDDDIDSDDSGTRISSGDVISGTITLASGTEPTDEADGDSSADDANTNTTLDFGFYPQVDLSVTKTVNVAASDISAGGQVVFDIVVQNDTPSGFDIVTATSVLFSDTLPAGLTFAGFQNLPAGSGAPTTNGQTTSVTLPDITADQAPVQFQLLADIAANQTADVTNTGVVSTTAQVDVDTANNSEPELVDVPEADLAITKTSDTDPVDAGGQLTYTITVTNNGPDDATGIVVTDNLPAGVTFNSSPNVVTEDPVGSGNLTIFLGNLAFGESVSATIVVDVDPDADDANPLDNTATVTADPNTDPDPSDNSDTDQTTIVRQVDVAVDKSVVGTPIAGSTVTYSVEVTNDGPSQARGVTVVDTLDANLTFVNGSFDAGTSGITMSPPNGQTLTFDVGTLDALETQTFTFDVMIDPSATGTIPNTATISTTDPDPNNTNDDSTVNIAPGREIDLILTKTVDRATAVPGQDQLVYTFVVSHDTDSVSDAATVQVTDVLPSGLIGAVIDAPGATATNFAPGTGTVTVDYDTIPIGETRTFTVTVDIQSDATGDTNGDVINPASVTSTGTELDPDNNSDTATTALTPQFDIIVDKSVNNPTPAIGSTVTYTVTVTNDGPSNANGVVLSDTIPSDLTFVSGSMVNGSTTNPATSDGTTVSFPGVSLAPDATATATLNFTVNNSAAGTITNTASVPDLSANGETDGTTNNSDTAEITVTPQVDLVLTKNVSLANAQVGSTLTYTVNVTNNGPSTATNVVVTDTLPSGVTFTSGTGPNGEALTAAGGVVTVNAGNVANAGTLSITINGTINAGSSGTLTNSATVVSDTNEVSTSNNSNTASTTVDPMTSSIQGSIYVDANNNGVKDAGEEPIPNVTVTLTGTDSMGNSVNQSTTTNAAGDYLFAQLAAGTYQIMESQPSGFRDGRETSGTGAPANVGDDEFNSLELGVNSSAVGFNFGELAEPLSKRRFLASSQ